MHKTDSAPIDSGSLATLTRVVLLFAKNGRGVLEPPFALCILGSDLEEDRGRRGFRTRSFDLYTCQCRHEQRFHINVSGGIGMYFVQQTPVASYDSA
jgi:hypothetical protein